MKDLIIILKKLDVVNKEPVKLKNAGISDFYIDIKKAYGNPIARDIMSKYVNECMPKETTCVAASGYGGLPLATTIASRYYKKLTMIRDNEKKHGMGGFIDGHVPTKKDKVYIIDDVFSTGGSLNRNIQVLKPTGAKILGCFVVVKRGEGKVESKLDYLLTPEDLL